MEEQEIIETPAMHAFRLRDLAQQYHNMLTCIHDLKSEEREQIQAWKTQAENELKSLESDAEVAIHP
ncbi:hypothetical protein PBT90_00060 [Algoriphagus halophytocola]|uniref:hypothetical protein n=1 Tax=Algoriphagus halophytocola TaxID=2991499 RepID=UPI0022DE236C|nr:hypothetical protein [Algoriphagus sp. TR-M9]WBL42362.1 hypothetical protein PBT90_16625 [Algoriphagus sp. TR-M9]WBL43101.1 hypothetical protein PBT90_00060 [Algoriphagus sp. TR-M9]